MAECGVTRPDIESDKGGHTCDPCSFDEQDVEAVGFCVACIEYLCKTCIRDHKKNKVTRHHTILQDNDIPDNVTSFQKLMDKMVCSSHPDKEVEYICEDHDEYICNVCVARLHRKCDRVKEIAEQSKETEICSRQNAESELKRLHLVLKRTIGLRKKKECNIKHLRKEEKYISEEREVMIRNIQEKLKQLDELCQIETNTLVEKEIFKIKKYIRKHVDIENDQLEDCDLLENVLKFGNLKQLKVVSSKILKKLEVSEAELEGQIRKAEIHIRFNPVSKHTPKESLGKICVEERVSLSNITDIENSSYCEEKSENENLSGDTTICNYLKTSSLNHSGEDEKRRTSKFDNTTNRNIEPICKVSTNQNVNRMGSLMERKLKRISCHNIKRETEKESNICGSVVLPDQRLVFIDKSNRKIKLYNKDFIFITTLELDYAPFALCHRGNDELVLTFSDVKGIGRYMVGKKSIYRHRDFETNMYGRGLTTVGQNIAVLFTDKDGEAEVNSSKDEIQIHIIDLGNASVVRTIDTFKNKHMSMIILRDPVSLLFRSENEILVTDSTHLRCFDSNGQLNWYFAGHKGHAIDDVYGLALDNEGHIYVCGAGSNNVHQISATKHMDNRILISDAVRPQSVSYDTYAGRLIVGCRNYNSVLVYKFE